jgi:2-keto-4-pentenoate hydratase/2-oxohepta-3-ene-1,7-dioic acid hydratase in catechol pathway
MELTRKSFLKGAVSVIAMALGSLSPFARAATRDTGRHAKGMARGLTLLTMQCDGKWQLGVKTDKGILNVPAAAAALHMSAPATMDELLKNEQGPALNALVEAALKSRNQKLFVPETSIVYGPVVTSPEKIVCIGLNYRQHAREIGMGEPKVPVLFSKFNNALNAHKGTIRLPTNVAKKFDHEVELVIIMGKEAHNVSEADALSYAAGYCTGNDFSARDLQLELDPTKQWLIGKSCDGFGVLGPYMVTADQIDPDNLKLECRVNGETHQSSNTSDLIHNTRKLISYISQHMTLRAGDVIYTGTPQGVIIGRPKDQQVWLKAGDKIACSVEKLGEQTFDLV